MRTFSPSLILIIGTIILCLIVLLSFRKKTRTHFLISFLVGLTLFLSLNDYVVKMQAELIVKDLFSYKYKNDIVPKTLNDIYDNHFMMITPTIDHFIYERQIVTESSYQWKLEFKNIWGTEYFYDDKTGDIEKRENWQGNNHWNKFNKTRNATNAK